MTNKEENKPRKLTDEEVKAKFIKATDNIVKAWSGYQNMTDYERCEGVAHSLLVLLDGGNIDIPGFIVAPLPAKEDKEYCKKNDENWYPQNHKSNVKCDISGSLHDAFNMRNKK